MGLILRRGIIALSVASVALAAVAFMPAGAGAGGQTPGAAALAPSIHLKGPNDGEPLNDKVDFQVEVVNPSSGVVVVYAGNHFLTSMAVEASAGLDVATLSLAIDTNGFPNGPLLISVFLFSEGGERLLAGAFFQSTVANPKLEVAEVAGDTVTLLLRPCAGDLSFRLEGGLDQGELLIRPETWDAPKDDVKTEASGPVSGDNGGTGSQMANAPDPITVVLSLDKLIQNYTSAGALVLWTSSGSKSMSHSRPLLLSELLRAGPRPARARIDQPIKNIYRR